MNFCTKCGNQLKPDARFCGKCGQVLMHFIPKENSNLSVDQQCSVCGVRSNPGVKFCISCGNPLSASPTPAFSKPPPIPQPSSRQTPPPIPLAYQQSLQQSPERIKPVRKKSRAFLKIAASVLIIGGIIIAGLYYYGTYEPGTATGSIADEETLKAEKQRLENTLVKTDSAALVVQDVFARADTAGLANILSPTSLGLHRQYFTKLLPYMPTFAGDFKNRELKFANERYAVYEYTSAKGKFTAEFCLGDNGKWMLMRF
ncbi:MAG: zinc ribbon domain-containing protein [Bacteroidota bacterium]